METQQIQVEHIYVSDRQTFEAMKAIQIESGKVQRVYKLAYKEFQRDGKPWYTPGEWSTQENGLKTRPMIPRAPQPSVDLRLHNVAYALVRGKRYAQVESKFLDRDGLRTYPLTRAEIESYLVQYPGVDTSRICWEGM